MFRELTLTERETLALKLRAAWYVASNIWPRNWLWVELRAIAADVVVCHCPGCPGAAS